jgi:BldD-like DNA-binding protein
MKWLMRLLGLEPRQEEPKPVEAPIAERRAQPDPEALMAAAKPSNHRPGLDLERLKSLPSSAYQPLTEYLSYIQVKRGETESLVFVRESDIDALAKMTGESRENFVKEFKRLGVLISMN